MLIVSLAMSLLAAMSTAGAPGGECNEAEIAAGLCSVRVVEGAVVVEATVVIPGQSSDESPSENLTTSDVVRLTPFQACMAAGSDQATCDRLNFTVIDNRPGAAAVGQAITLSDLAQFRPIVGELIVEPDGWGVVGTPTNFYATAETHVMAGELFDLPIEVRWTPSSYVFDYGDGTVETSDASGAAWRGTKESWTETATSHAYAERIDVTASLTVVFTAEVDAGSGWFAVPGTLPVAAPSVDVKVFEVDTVLTNGDCMANPSAAGCG